MTNRPDLPTETTPEGEQIVAPGVKPIRLKDRLDWRMRQPMAPKRNPDAAQKPCDLGLFDVEGRRQIDWIDEMRKGKP